MLTKTKPILVIYLCLIFVSIFYVSVYAKEKESVRSSVQLEKATPVEVLTVRSQDLPLVLKALGRLYGNRKVTVTSQVPGTIESFRGDVGAAVTTGQILVQINQAEYRLVHAETKAKLGLAQARLSVAEKKYQRAQKLLPRKAISPDSFDKIEAEFKAAQAQTVLAEVGVQAALEKLKKTTLKAPFNSLVTARHIETGQTVGTGVPLYTLVDLSQVRVKVQIGENEYVHLDHNDPVKVEIEAYPNRSFQGRIDRIGIEAGPGTTTFPVEILINNNNLRLKAGLSAQVFFTTRVLPGVILIPKSAVLRNRDAVVLVVGPNNTVQTHPVKLGQTKGDQIQVLDGLVSGDRVIVKGQKSVKAGDRVAITNLK